MCLLISELKRITSNYYNDYIKLLSKKINKIEEVNYISNDIIKFIKHFIDKHNENLDIESLNQYLKTEADNFSELMESIMDVVTQFSINVLDNIKSLFVEKNILNINKENKDIINSDEEDSIIENPDNLNIGNGDDNLENLSSDKLNKNDYLLLNGDEIYLEKMDNIKNKKKEKSNYPNNMLDDLSI